MEDTKHLTQKVNIINTNLNILANQDHKMQNTSQNNTS